MPLTATDVKIVIEVPPFEPPLPAIPLGDEQEADELPKIVVVVHGGCVVSVMCDEPATVAIVDFDAREDWPPAMDWGATEPWDVMDKAVRAAIEGRPDTGGE